MNENIVTIYFLDKDCVYAGSYDVIEGKYKELSTHTLIKPPKFSSNTTGVFNRDSNTWEVVDDFRGEIVYNEALGRLEVVEYVGALKPYHKRQYPNVVDVKGGQFETCHDLSEGA